jgi:hypothetical protein
MLWLLVGALVNQVNKLFVVSHVTARSFDQRYQIFRATCVKQIV